MKRRPDTASLLGSTLVLALLAVPGPAQAASVRAQLGDHGDYSRLVLTVPKGLEPVAVVDGCVLRIGTPDPVRWPLASLRDSFSRRLSDFVTADDGRSLTAAIPCGARVASFIERRMLIVDVGGPPVPGVKPRAPFEVQPEAVVAAGPEPTPAPLAPPSVATIAEALNPIGTANAAPANFPLPVESPLPPGERVRVRGERGEDSRDGHAMHPPHPDPLPGGERGILPGSEKPSPALPLVASLEGEVRSSIEDTLRRLERMPDRTAKPAPQAAEPPKPPAPPPIAAMDLAAWAGDDFNRTREALQRAVGAAQGRARVDAQIALIRFLLARAMDEEGRAALEMAASLSPAPDQRYTLRILGDAFRALDREDAPDDNLFVQLPAGVMPDHTVWRSVALAPTSWAAAKEGLPIALRRLLDYPPDLRSRLLTTLAAASDEAGDSAALNLIVLGMITVDSKGMADGRLDYFRGRLAELKATPDAALERYDAAAGQRRGPFARRAEVRAIELRRSLGRLDEDGAIAALEALRFAWRGDEIETDALAALGSAYARSGKTDAALDIFGLLGRRFGATARGRDALAAGRDLLAAVLDHLDRSPPGGLYALALQARHGRLVALADSPDGKLRQRLAALLLRDGYALEATRILHALTESATGSQRAELGATLARALIDSGREAEALDVLTGTGSPTLEPALAERRALLRADALLGDGDTVRALDALRGLTGAEAARLRAQGLFAAGEWPAARKAFAELAATGAEPTAEDIALQGLSAYLAGDGEALRGLGETQRTRLAGTRWAGLLDALAPPPAAGPLRAESVERDLAAAAALDRLARDWRGKP
ncbi:hypothetical protein [Azospirillum lipoferum]|uniref:Tetratricopeptide repeat protein n=1 Tax=Azospirillum lipoferum (strain 4B) TaxID=862719 RepID=G7ZHN5_AZOL4|nr:hypothetical protein [Azospirillum lipoferum]CBS91024.1 protein of unknown function [Azospirillum lipoferum 4B]